MYWKLHFENAAEAVPEVAAGNRFVVHRHRDAWGEHLDLRLELDGYLMGWRIEGDALDGTRWATEKAPHPLDWLDTNRGMARVDGGTYVRRAGDGDGLELLLQGSRGVCRLTAERGRFIPASAAHALDEVMAARQVTAEDVARLVDDGLTARDRVVCRLLGLGRELDGAAFDEPGWRRMLAGMALEDIHRQLRSFEIRFDRKYPPMPVSRPEALPEEGMQTRACSGKADPAVMAILQE